MYGVLANVLIGKGARQDALETVNSARKAGLDSAELHVARFKIALLEGDSAPSLRERAWPKEDSDEDRVLYEEASFAEMTGKLRIARQKTQEAAQRMLARGHKESASTYQSDMAVVEAEFGESSQARKDIGIALKRARKPNVLENAALVFSLTGEKEEADVVLGELRARFPNDALLNQVWIPAVRATFAINSGNSGEALNVLEVARPFELGAAAEFTPIYVRGLAHLRAKDGVNACREFQKILENRGVSVTSEHYPLAMLGNARALALAGDHDQSRQFYEKFLNLWSEADPDIPVLREARAEYARLSAGAQ